MAANEWAAVVIAAIAVISGFTATIGWLVKHFLYELKPNGGSSLKDSVVRLESKVEMLHDLVIELVKK